MKKLIVTFLALAFSANLYAATATQAQSLGYATVYIDSRTVAQMDLLAPKQTGQLLYVSDATQARLCISSGTGTGAWTIAVATGTFGGSSYPHCK